MIRTTLIFLLSFLFSVHVFSQEKNQITYIANEGVLIEVNDAKVLIDALHDEHLKFYQSTKPPYRQLISSGTAPFDSVDLFLVTHLHGDHFDVDLTIDFFEKHQETILVAPQQVLDTMGRLPHLEAQFYPLRGSDTGTMYVMDGITIQAVPLLHSYQKKNAWIENMAYLLDFEGFKILHVGDAEFSPENLKRIKKAIGKGVDYAILPDWFFVDNTTVAKVNKVIKAKKYIAVHVMKVKTGAYSKELKKRLKAFKMELNVFRSVGQFETITK